MTPLIYRNIWSSVVKKAQELITASTSAGYGTPQFLDWDAHANIHELPNVDLLGPTALGMVEEDKIIRISFSIAISTWQDTNLFRMRDQVGLVFEALRPQKQLVYYDSLTALAVSHITIVDGTTLPPMSRTEVRPFQFVHAEGLLTPTSSS